LLQKCGSTIWLCDNETVKPFPGDIREYKKYLVAQTMKNHEDFAKGVNKK
jgi:hypothetical protein